jgi:hypothetical protein
LLYIIVEVEILINFIYLMMNKGNNIIFIAIFR